MWSGIPTQKNAGEADGHSGSHTHQCPVNLNAGVAEIIVRRGPRQMGGHILQQEPDHINLPPPVAARTLQRGDKAVYTAAGAEIVPGLQSGPILNPLPSGKLHTVFGWMPRQDYIVEVRQRPIAVGKATDSQLGDPSHLLHILGGGAGDIDHPVQSLAPDITVHILQMISNCSAVKKAEPFPIQVHRQEAVLLLQAYGEAFAGGYAPAPDNTCSSLFIVFNISLQN